MDDPVARELAQIRADLRDDLADIKSALAGLLPREVYAAHHEALVARVVTLEREVSGLEDQIEKDAEKAEAKRVASRRWMVSAIVFPIISVALSIVLAVMKP